MNNTLLILLVALSSFVLGNISGMLFIAKNVKTIVQLVIERESESDV